MAVDLYLAKEWKRCAMLVRILFHVIGRPWLSIAKLRTRKSKNLEAPRTQLFLHRREFLKIVVRTAALACHVNDKKGPGRAVLGELYYRALVQSVKIKIEDVQCIDDGDRGSDQKEEGEKAFA